MLLRLQNDSRDSINSGSDYWRPSVPPCRGPPSRKHNRRRTCCIYISASVSGYSAARSASAIKDARGCAILSTPGTCLSPPPTPITLLIRSTCPAICHNAYITSTPFFARIAPLCCRPPSRWNAKLNAPCLSVENIAHQQRFKAVFVSSKNSTTV